jgi:hypothetical protein
VRRRPAVLIDADVWCRRRAGRCPPALSDLPHLVFPAGRRRRRPGDGCQPRVHFDDTRPSWTPPGKDGGFSSVERHQGDKPEGLGKTETTVMASGCGLLGRLPDPRPPEDASATRHQHGGDTDDGAPEGPVGAATAGGTCSRRSCGQGRCRSDRCFRCRRWTCGRDLSRCCDWGRGGGRRRFWRARRGDGNGSVLAGGRQSLPAGRRQDRLFKLQGAGPQGGGGEGKSSQDPRAVGTRGHRAQRNANKVYRPRGHARIQTLYGAPTARQESPVLDADELEDGRVIAQGEFEGPQIRDILDEHIDWKGGTTHVDPARRYLQPHLGLLGTCSWR